MGHATGQLADGFKLLRLAQRRFGLVEQGGAFHDPLFQGRIQIGQCRQALADDGIGAHPFDMRPGALRDLTQQRQVVGRPAARHAVVNGHQRGQASGLDQRHANRRRHTQSLEGRGFLGRQFRQVVINDQRLTGLQALDCQLAEVGQAVVPDNAGRTFCSPVAANGKAVFIGLHVGIGAVGQVQVGRQYLCGGRHDRSRIGGIGYTVADRIQHGEAAGHEHRAGSFGDGIENAHDVAAGIADRAVAKREIGLVRRITTLDDQWEVFDKRCVACKCGIGDRADLAPGFLPDGTEGLAECIGFATKDRDEGVVVQGGQLGAPHHRLGKVGGQAQGHGGLEHIRPLVHRPQGRVGPVVAANPFGHFTAAL